MKTHLPSKLRLLLVFHLLSKFLFAAAGTCWTSMSSPGHCKEILYERSDKETCCADHSQSTSWSDSNLDPGSLFFWRMLGGGVKCYSCRDSCENVKCDAEKSCVIRKGIPKCVCSSKCKENKLKSRGMVCGTDGRSYRNICRLKKRACRKRTATLTVAYNGTCQKSCKSITCPSGKRCILDQNLNPHCVNCSHKCQKRSKRHQVCGSDHQTYASQCHLKQDTCNKGKANPIAYRGPCKTGANCDNVRCPNRQMCLTDRSGRPRCTTCSLNCRPKHMHGPICGTNNVTYLSWCHMIQDSCTKGIVFETQYSGECNGTLST